MAMTPIDPSISPRIELNHKDPKIDILRDEEWTCPECLEHYVLEEEGKDRLCVLCMIKRKGGSVMIMGWTITKGSSQIIAQPPMHRIDGK